MIQYLLLLLTLLLYLVLSVKSNLVKTRGVLRVLYVRSTDAGTIAETLLSFLQQKQLDLRKLIGQGYDGAATLAGKVS